MRGIVYKLTNLITKQIYIGSSCNSVYGDKPYQILNTRIIRRKSQYELWLQGKSMCSDNHKLFNNIYEYGFESFYIKIIKIVDIPNQKELERIEGEYIRKYDSYFNGLNHRLPNITKEERNKHRRIKYANTPMEVKRAKRPEPDLEYRRRYYHKTKDRERFKCEKCDFSTNEKSSWTKHINSKRHKIKEKHLINGVFVCDICNKTINTYEKFNRHYKNFHTNREQYLAQRKKWRDKKKMTKSKLNL